MPAFLRSLAIVASGVLLSGVAHAQLFRAYLASDGNDANPCTLAAPCRLLPRAISAVAPGGSVWMLDSANFNTGTVTIDKSVSILAVPGAIGSVVATGTPALSITAPGLNVALRNLVVQALPGTVGHGVAMTGASQLSIEGCLIAGISGYGVTVSGPGSVRIADSTLRDISAHGVFVLDGATALLSHARILRTGGVVAGAMVAGRTLVSVTDSVISGGAEGAYAYAFASGARALAIVTRSTIEGTTWGLESGAGAGGTAVVEVDGSLIVNNHYAWFVTGPESAFVRTTGNNRFVENVTVSGVLSPVPLQ